MGADIPEPTTQALPAEDAELVDLLTAVLVDSNLYTSPVVKRSTRTAFSFLTC